MRDKLLLPVLLLSLSPPAFAVPLTGTVFEQGSAHKNALFAWQRVEEGDPAHLTVVQTYRAPDGKPAVVEKATLENGKIRQYTIDQRQTDEQGVMIVRDGKVHFEYTKDGKTRTADEDEPENLVVTGTVTDWVAAHAEPLLKGETLHVRFGVLDRRETVGFKFFKIDEGKRDGKDTVTIKMKPTSFVIAAIVDPLLFIYEKDGGKIRIAEIQGRTMPKRNVNGKWKDLDADTVYVWK